MASENVWDDPWADDSSDDDAKDGGGREDREETFGAQHVLVLIDCRPSMFVPSIPTKEDGKTISPMQAALEACERLLRSKVKHVAVHKTGKRDGVGVMLYGLASEEKSTHTLVALEPPGVEQIQKIRRYLSDTESVKKEIEEVVKDEPNRKHEWSLRRGLQGANKGINEAKCVRKRKAAKKELPDGKSLWIFTTDDDPLFDEEENKVKGQEMIEKATSDVVENNVDIHVWPMKTPFNSDFYDSILPMPVEETQETFDLEDLMDRIQLEFRKQRRAFVVPMLLPDWRTRPDDPGIMIDFFRPVQIQRKPQPLSIHQETMKETIKFKNILEEATGKTLYSSADNDVEAKARYEEDGYRLRTYAVFGDKTVTIVKPEVAEMKKESNADKDKASLILLGFKPKDSVPAHYAVEQHYYLYPNEDKVKGSTAAFANLHDAMIRKGVVAIAELLTRVTATSRLVAIFPQEAEYLPEEEGGGLQTPPGMCAAVLPFEDDVRALDADTGMATDASVQAATELINALKFEDDLPLDYLKNDSLLHFYTYMESIALETTLPTPEQSLNQITDEDLRETAGEQIDAFIASLPEDIKEEKQPKKRKFDPGEPVNWVRLYKRNEIAECTIPMLKDYLKSQGEKVSGKKAVLVEKVSLNLASRIESGELQDV